MKLPIVSSEDVVRVPAFYKKEQDRKRLVIVPKRKEIPKGTLSSILEQAGLTREKFLELLKR